MRHFGHGVGHLKYERQYETEPDMALEDMSHSSDNDAHTDELENGTVDSEEEKGSTNREIVGDDEGDWEGEGDASDDNISDADSDSDGSGSDGYDYGNY